MTAGEVGVRLTFTTGVTLTGGTITLTILSPNSVRSSVALVVDTPATQAYYDTLAATFPVPGRYLLQVTAVLTGPTRTFISNPIELQVTGAL